MLLTDFKRLNWQFINHDPHPVDNDTQFDHKFPFKLNILIVAVINSKRFREINGEHSRLYIEPCYSEIRERARFSFQLK